jgi:hypothetical protein
VLLNNLVPFMNVFLKGLTKTMRIMPDDPVKYNFALTRPGIWDDTDLNAASFLKIFSGGV